VVIFYETRRRITCLVRAHTDEVRQHGDDARSETVLRHETHLQFRQTDDFIPANSSSSIFIIRSNIVRWSLLPTPAGDMQQLLLHIHQQQSRDSLKNSGMSKNVAWPFGAIFTDVSLWIKTISVPKRSDKYYNTRSTTLKILKQSIGPKQCIKKLTCSQLSLPHGTNRQIKGKKRTKINREAL